MRQGDGQQRGDPPDFAALRTWMKCPAILVVAAALPLAVFLVPAWLHSRLLIDRLFSEDLADGHKPGPSG